MPNRNGHSKPDEAVSTTWITGTVLAVSLAGGAGGAPLVGALREGVQEQFALPFWVTGAGVAVLGLAAGILGLIIARRLPGIGRLALFRAGLVLSFLAFGLYCFLQQSNFWAIAGLAAGWFVLSLGVSFTGTANAIFADLWHHSPHTGVILLHVANSIGKVVAPAMVLVIGASLGGNARVYAVIWLVLTLAAFTWPTKAISHLNRTEHRQHAAARKAPSVLRSGLFWLVCLQFAVIAGSEAGVTSMLPSFIEKHRQGLWGFSARGFSQVVLVVMLLGIVAGRCAALAFSRRVGERGIIKVCLPCAAAAVPAVLYPAPAVFLPCFFVLGFAFSATWPAYFAMAVRRFPNDKTVLSIGVTVCSLAGINGYILTGSLIGNNPAYLPWAVLASAVSIALFAVCFFALPMRRPGSTDSSASAAG